jgi:glutathione S-transferase
MIEQYQFYFSHYCEKARWALDYRGASYKSRNLIPRLHTSPRKGWRPRLVS